MPQARYQSTIEPDNSLPILQSQYQSSIEPDNSLTVPRARYQTSNELATYFPLMMITTTPESQQAEQFQSPLLPRSKALSEQAAKAEVHEQDDQQQTVESLKSEAQTTAESSSGIVMVNEDEGEGEKDKEDLLCDE